MIRNRPFSFLNQIKQAGILFFLLLMLARPAHAFIQYQDTNRFLQGFQKIFLAPFYLPIRILQGTIYDTPIIGTVKGTFMGAFETVSMVVSGVFDMVGAAAPYAKYAAIPFL